MLGVKGEVAVFVTKGGLCNLRTWSNRLNDGVAIVTAHHQLDVVEYMVSCDDECSWTLAYVPVCLRWYVEQLHATHVGAFARDRKRPG